LTLLETNEQNLRSVESYRETNFSVDLEQIHIVDKVDLLKQTREMLNRDVIHMTLDMKKLQKVKKTIEGTSEIGKGSYQDKANKDWWFDEETLKTKRQFKGWGYNATNNELKR